MRETGHEDGCAWRLWTREVGIAELFSASPMRPERMTVQTDRSDFCSVSEGSSPNWRAYIEENRPKWTKPS